MARDPAALLNPGDQPVRPDGPEDLLDLVELGQVGDLHVEHVARGLQRTGDQQPRVLRGDGGEMLEGAVRHARPSWPREVAASSVASR